MHSHRGSRVVIIVSLNLGGTTDINLFKGDRKGDQKPTRNRPESEPKPIQKPIQQATRKATGKMSKKIVQEKRPDKSNLIRESRYNDSSIFVSLHNNKGTSIVNKDLNRINYAC